jgi:MSHA biogenesis protein MshP
MNRSRQRIGVETNQRGFTLVQAIFVLVVLGLLGAYMVTLGTVQQATSTQALLQARAYQAARAGLEWGLARVAAGVAVGAAFTVADTGCRVVVSIDEPGDSPYSEGVQSVRIYHITATASPVGLTVANPDYVSRELQVTVYEVKEVEEDAVE